MPLLDVSLVEDRREQVVGAGIHALLIGVSAYDHLPPAEAPNSDPHFKMRGLASPALTAWQLACWLRDPATRVNLPLKTLRILTSPAAQEMSATAHPAGPQAPKPPTRENIQYALRQWRIDASERSDDVTVFYFGGHGVRGDAASAVMLASDFLATDWTPMDRGFTFADVRDGMGPHSDRPNIANQQFYFVDCCRNDVMDPAATEDRARWAFLSKGHEGDGRARIALFATVDGSEAAATNGCPTYFGQMLLDALRTGSVGLRAGQAMTGPTRWPVTSTSLFSTLMRFARERSLKPVHSDSVFAPMVNGLTGPEPVLCWLDRPPEVNLAFELLPADLREDAIVVVKPSEGTEVPASLPMETRANSRGRHLLRLPTGRYELQVRSASLSVPALTFGEIAFDQSMPYPLQLDLNAATEVPT